ncbi:hypothetical protein MTO96_026801 [Rhipicephalus appendiculatus]
MRMRKELLAWLAAAAVVEAAVRPEGMRLHTRGSGVCLGIELPPDGKEIASTPCGCRAVTRCREVPQFPQCFSFRASDCMEEKAAISRARKGVSAKVPL